MVLIHCNIHASQKHPLEFFNQENIVNDSTDNRTYIKVVNDEGSVKVKKFNTNDYSILDDEAQNGYLFDQEYFYTFVTEVQNIDSMNLVLNVFIYSTFVGTTIIRKHHLHDDIYGSVKADLLHPISKEQIGFVNFDYLILPSETTHNLSAGGSTKYEPIFHEFVYMGHRGSGSTKLRTLPQLENTISSFITAHQQGASFVELDVQLTKDFVPVVFHDDFAAVLEEKDDGTEQIHKIPVKDLSYSDIRSKKIDFARPDAGLNYDERFQSLFPTVEELVTSLPTSLGIFMEIKYPEPDQGIEDPIRKDVFVDRILDVMSHVTIKQPMMFCSFDTEICLMLKHKQDLYPVFFITVGENAFTTRNPWSPYDMRTRTRGMAANFAICHGLKGISINSDPLVNSKTDYITLTTYLKEHDKMLFSWGGANDNEEYAAIQKSVKMTGVISDKLGNLKINRDP